LPVPTRHLYGFSEVAGIHASLLREGEVRRGDALEIG
jgi:hypothetical protein